jgi:hypothetical protein
MAFHAIVTGLGAYFVGKPALAKAARSADPASESIEAK